VPTQGSAPNNQSFSRTRGPFKSKLIAAIICAILSLGGCVFSRALPRLLIKAGEKAAVNAATGTHSNNGEVSSLGFLVAVVVVVIIDCLWFLFKGRAERLSESLKAPLADDVLERDKRPPILYLRSFEDDTSLYPDHERDLVAALAPFGPVIAIGRPGEFLQTLGAARAYCGDDWKEQVRHWIDTCALVVIRIGESQGLRWEIDMVTASLKANRLLLQVPRLTSRNEAVLVDRVVRTITRGNHDHDYNYNNVNYIYFNDSLRPSFIKGQLAIPARSGKDEHNLQLSSLYQQMFSKPLENYWEHQEREKREKRAKERRGRNVELAVLFSILAVLVVMLLICAGVAILKP
jgi:hypothetical protein